MSNSEVCRLCGSNAPLALSHIMPSFVFLRQKNASSTGYLRFGQVPNRRQQDGLKLRFLCCSCEQRFNQWETPFATELFHPFHDRERPPYAYGPWLARMAASVAWRALSYLKEQPQQPPPPPNANAHVEHALASWKSFCLGEAPDIGRNELHLIPLDTIAQTGEADLPAKINRYFLCTSEFDFLHSETTAVVLVKMLRLVIIGFVHEPEAHLWHGTKINLSGGQLAPQRLSIPDWLIAHFRSRAERLAEREQSLSAKQRDKAAADQAKNARRVIDSETMRAVLADQMLQQENR